MRRDGRSSYATPYEGISETPVTHARQPGQYSGNADRPKRVAPNHVSRTRTAWLPSLVFAVVGGILLAKGSFVGGAVLVVFAIIAAVGNYKDEDSSGLYGE
jgi:hypothetical protein